ncbi:MAG: hypothetical protein IPJ98_04250 [Bryobacterales bacterium]|nr:hypothetical protein [Bryobacterales bacterium]
MRLHPRLEAGLLAAASAAACLAAGYATRLQPAGAQTWSATFGAVFALGFLAGARLQTVGEQAVREGQATPEWNSIPGVPARLRRTLLFALFLPLIAAAGWAYLSPDLPMCLMFLIATTTAVHLTRQLSIRTQGAP